MNWGRLYDRSVNGLAAVFAGLGAWGTFHPPAPQMAATRAAHSPWWAVSLLVLGVVLLMISLYRAVIVTRRGPAISKWNPRGVNVSRYYAHPQGLEEDHRIVFVLSAFNATGSRIRIVKIEGKMFAVGFGSTFVTSNLPLPTPQIILNREFTEQHEQLSSFQLKIEQWMPRSVAVEFHRRLLSGEGVELGLDSLRIVIAPTDGPLQSAVLRLADSIKVLSPDPAEAQPAIIVKAAASNARVGAR